MDCTEDGRVSEGREESSDEAVTETDSLNKTSPPRERWGNKMQFLLMVVGFAVGLGNVWRFPMVAFKNGGGAFLIPYFVCSVIFGFPGVFFEFCVGQYTSSGAPLAMKKFAPILQGIGWTMVYVGSCVSVYYNVLMAWVLVYIYKILALWIEGKPCAWSSCGNEWNTEWCHSMKDNQECVLSSGGNLTFAYMDKCYDQKFKESLVLPKNLSAVAASQEFYENYLLQKTSSLVELGGVNTHVLYGLSVIWVLTALTTMFGIKLMGILSYCTSIMPYIIVGILFVRGITLDGAYDGIRYFIIEPDFQKLLEMNTWVEALTQVCYSLSLGSGGLLTMASYNDRGHNSHMTALLVVVFDSLMSIIGGLAVFSILGYFAKQMKLPLKEVVDGGPGLAFIVYPEALSQMPVGSLWALLFFIMLFFLGITTQFGIIGLITSSLSDVSPARLGTTGAKRMIVVGYCIVAFLAGFICVTRGGVFWFTIYDAFFGPVPLCICAVAEFLGISFIYGWRNFRDDLKEMFGTSESRISQFIGPTGWFFSFSWAILAPICGIIVTVVSCTNDPLSYGRGDRFYRFPEWTNILRWIFTFAPSTLIPIVALISLSKAKRAGQEIQTILEPMPSLPSYDRIVEKKLLKENDEENSNL